MSLSPLSTATTAATALSNLVLVSPNLTIGYQPMNPSNPDGSPSTAPLPDSFLFHYEGEQTATMDSDITDHYIEDNTAIQDQIALRPVMITTQGYIGELNDVVPKLLSPLYSIAQNLQIVSAYTPALSATALIAYNEAFQLYQVAANAANSAISAWSSISGTGGTNVIADDSVIEINPVQNKQQTAFQQFYGWWVNRYFFTLQTPWAIFENMVIKTIRPIQSAETNVITTFECTFKQIRTASSALTPPQSAVSQGRLSQQSSDVTNQGTSTPPSSTSSSSALGGSFGSSFPSI